MREELSNATSKQQKAEQDREEAEMKIAEVSYIHLLISLVKKDLVVEIWLCYCLSEESHMTVWLTWFNYHSLKLKEDIQMRNNEAQREARKKEKIEKELKQAKNDLEARNAELKTKTGNLQRAQEENTKLEQQLKEQRVRQLWIW
mgnify:CR=1 FL=1